MTMDCEPTARAVSAAETRRLCGPWLPWAAAEAMDRPDRADADAGMTDANADRVRPRVHARAWSYVGGACRRGTDSGNGPNRTTPPADNDNNMYVRACMPVHTRTRALTRPVQTDEGIPNVHDPVLEELLASREGASIDAVHLHRSMLPPDPSAPPPSLRVLGPVT